MKKNINKLKAQAQAMISTETSLEEGNEEEDINGEEEGSMEKYPIQETGWHCVSSFPISWVQQHITSLSL